MGLLSSRTFRQVALGAAGRYQEKRQTMRDRIDEYRERALAEKEKIQTKYNESYAEEKDKVNALFLLSLHFFWGINTHNVHSRSNNI